MTRTASDRHDRVRRLKNEIVYFFFLCHDLHLMMKRSLVFKQHSEYRAWFAGSNAMQHAEDPFGTYFLFVFHTGAIDLILH